MAIRIIEKRGIDEGTKALITNGLDVDSLPESALLSLFQSGSEPAFRELMRRHKGIIWRVVRRYLGSLDEVEDIYQEISLRLYHKSDIYVAGAAKFSSWLYRVCANHCLDILRSRKCKIPSAQLHDDIPAEGMTAEESMSSRERSALLHGLLKDIPAQQRKALVLHYYHDIDIANIASCLQISEGASRALIKRGRRSLRDRAALLSV